MAKEYLVQIISNKGTSTFSSNRFNWKDVKLELARSKTYKGIVSSFTNKFSFIKDARSLMRSLWDSEGINAFAKLIIKVSNQNAERNSYNQIGENQTFTANFSDAEINETKCDINFEDTGFVNDFFAGHKTKLNFDMPNNLKGGMMSDYTTDLDVITLHDRTIQFDNELRGIGEIEYVRHKLSASFLTFPVNKVFSDDDNYKTVVALTTEDLSDAETYYYLKSDATRVLSTDININAELSIGGVFSGDVSLAIRLVDENFTIISIPIILQTQNYPSGGGTKTYTYSGTRDITVLEGWSIQIGFIIDSAPALVTSAMLNNLTESFIKGSSTEYYPASIAQCIKPFRLFRRLTEIITGDADAFYSDLFGLTDDGYSEDGEWANLVSLNGKMIRQFAFKDNPYNATLESVFKYYNSIVPIALSIETIGGKQMIRIEKYDSLYGSEVVVELGGNISELKRMVRSDSIFTDIIVGYKDQEYEVKNGLDSAHGEVNYTTPLNIKDKKYDIKCKARAGGNDIEEPRRKPFETFPTTDTRYDKDNYLIDAYVTGGNLVARRDELFSSITGVSNPQYIYNARLLPGRNLKRHGGLIKESLTKNDNDSLIYTKGPSNPNVTSQLLTESSPVVEKDNVSIADLERPKVLTELLSFVTSLTLAEFNLISLNKNKIVTFVDVSQKVLSIYIDELKYNEPKGEAEITGIRANI